MVCAVEKVVTEIQGLLITGNPQFSHKKSRSVVQSERYRVDLPKNVSLECDFFFNQKKGNKIKMGAMEKEKKKLRAIQLSVDFFTKRLLYRGVVKRQQYSKKKKALHYS